VQTNNVAEYRGVLLGIARAKALGAQVSSSFVQRLRAVARQLDGSYRVKHPAMIELFTQARGPLAGFRAVVDQDCRAASRTSAPTRVVNQALRRRARAAGTEPQALPCLRVASAAQTWELVAPVIPVGRYSAPLAGRLRGDSSMHSASPELASSEHVADLRRRVPRLCLATHIVIRRTTSPTAADPRLFLRSARRCCERNVPGSVEL